MLQPLHSVDCIGAALVLAVLLLPPNAESQDCEALCLVPQLTGDGLVHIDANSGKVLDGGTRFADGTQLQIVVSGMNPFHYVYRFPIKSEPLDTAIASQFLNFVPGFSALINGAVGTKLQEEAVSAGAAACKDEENGKKLEVLLEKGRPLATASAELKIEYADLADVQENRLAPFLRQVQSSNIECTSACRSAAALRQEQNGLSIKNLYDFDDLPARTGEFSTNVTTLQPDLDSFLATSCANAAEVQEDLKKLKALKDDADAYGESLKSLQSNATNAKHTHDIIEGVFSADQPFVFVRYPQTTDGPTGAQLAIFRRDLLVDNASETQIATLNFTVGKSPLSFSAGLGFSTIGEQVVGRQSGLVPDGMGGTTVGSIFGLLEDSDTTVGITLALNANLIPIGKRAKETIAWTVGMTFENVNTGNNVGFFTGPSVTFLDGSFIATLGYHFRKAERLAGGFEIGDPIPPEVQDPLPTTNETVSGVILALTYKMR